MPHLSGRFDRPTGWRRWSMLFLLAVVVCASGGYLYLASPSRVAKLAGDLLTAMAGADVRIESAHFGFDGMVTLRQVEIRIRNMTGPEAMMFDAERVLIQHNVLSLIKGEFRPRTLRFINPTLHLTEITDSGKFNLQHLQQQRTAPSQSQSLPLRLPEIILRNGRVLHGRVDAEGYRELDAVYLGGNLNPSREQPGTYFFALRHDPTTGDDGDYGLAVTGKLDMQRFKLDAKIDQVALHAKQRVMLPGQLRQWWDQLEPVGSLPSVRFGYDPDPEIGLHAELELRGVSITLPYGELDSRMTDVSGRFRIVNQTISIINVTGRIEDLNYQINGLVHGFRRDAPFELSVRTDPFAIPEKPRYLLALPTAVQKQFKRFTPSGLFQAEAVVQRSETGGRLVYDGTVELSDAKLLYHQFPYPLESVRGVLRFNDEQIELVNLRGRGPTGANVTVTGVIAPPRDGAAVHVVVIAVDSPVDHVLYDAVPEEHRPILDMFFNQEAHQRLLDRGLIQTADQQRHWLEQLDELRSRADADELSQRIEAVRSKAEIPVFELGGRATVFVQSSRELGPDRKFRTTIGLDVSGVNALYEYWPYPARGVSGKLLIKPHEVVADSIELEGIGGAVGTVTGQIALGDDRRDEPLTPNLAVTIKNMACDPLLTASIPEPQDGWLRQLELAGRLDVNGRIFRNTEEDRIDYRFDARLAKGRVQPHGGRFIVEQIAGSATLGSRGITFDSMAGDCGSGRLSLTGNAAWGDDASQLDLRFDARSMALDRSVLDALPRDDPALKPLTELFDHYRPTGLLNARLDYQYHPHSRASYRLDVGFERLEFWLGQTPIALSDLTGSFVATPQAVELARWGGSFSTGQFRLSGSIGLGDQAYCDLTFDAQARKVCQTTRAVLPEEVLGVIDGLELNGAYEMHNAHLVYRPHEEQSMFNFRGVARLSDASATVGVPITQMNGDLEIHATRRADSVWPRLDLKFESERLLAAGRLTSPLSLHIASDERPDRLSIRDLRGSCYGGTLFGSGQIELGQTGLYRMNLVLQDVALNPFLHPQQPHEQPHATPQDAPGGEFSGILAASLSIEGSSLHPTKRRGRGELEIRQANLYEVPLSLALIQILNLSLPSSRSFDRASASYLIDDDLVLFDSVRFEAPTIEIVGTGLMRYSTLALDLDLYTRNPSGRRFGMIADLLGVFKDELLSIHVTGTLDDPKPNATSFQGIRRSWQELFGTSRKLNHRLLPGVRGGAATSGQ